MRKLSYFEVDFNIGELSIGNDTLSLGTKLDHVVWPVTFIPVESEAKVSCSAGRGFRVLVFSLLFQPSIVELAKRFIQAEPGLVAPGEGEDFSITMCNPTKLP